MINLLPTNYAQAIRYARQNATLLRWIIGGLVATAGLLLILAGGWIYIDQQTKDLQAGINQTNQRLAAKDLSHVEKDAKEITGDIKVINKLLSSEVRFSDLIEAIGNDMPPGAVLSNLSLNDKVSGAVNLSAETVDHPSAAQIAVNLGQSQNNLFSKIDIVSITCSRTNVNQTYPCTAIYKALFSKSAQTKFLSVAHE